MSDMTFDETETVLRKWLPDYKVKEIMDCFRGRMDKHEQEIARLNEALNRRYRLSEIKEASDG